MMMYMVVLHVFREGRREEVRESQEKVRDHHQHHPLGEPHVPLQATQGASAMVGT